MRFILILILITSSLLSHKNIEKVSLQLDWKYQFEFAGFIAAKEKGFYHDAGLDVELREYQNSVDTASDIINRKATYGTYNTSIIVSGDKPAPVVLLATYFQRSPLVFAVQKGIDNPADLIGKKIMGTSDEFSSSSLGLMLNHFGITANNAILLPNSFNLNDFIEGKIDAISAFRSNELYELNRRHIPYTILDPYDYGFMMSAVNLFTSHSEALENPERTQRFIDASNRGWQYALNHPDEMVDLLLKKYHTDKSREALMYEYKVTKKMMMIDFYPVGQANEELTVRAYKQLVQSGRISSDQPLGKFMFKDIVASVHGIQMTTAQKQYLLNKKEITMCVDPEWYPFEAIRKNHHIGIAADVMKEFEKQLGTRIKLIPTISWQESIEDIKNHNCDILSLASSTPERLRYMDFTSPYITVPIVMATKMDKPFIEDITSLGKKKLGVVKGYAIEEELRLTHPDLNLIEVTSITDGLKRVESGELYGYVDNLMVVSSYIQKEHTGTLKVSSRLKESLYLAVGTRNDEPLLHDIFEKLVVGIDPVMIQKIYNRYAPVLNEQNPYKTIILRVLVIVALISVLLMVWNILLRRKVKEAVAKNLLQANIVLQKSKQAEIGNLIANISHQWREPLSKLSSINLLTLANLKTGRKIDETVLLKQCEKIEETLEFMSHTMQNFLEFYKKSDIPATFNLMESIYGTLSIIETKILDNAIMITITGDETVEISGIKNEWMQVWLNLINNSIEILKSRQITNPSIRIHATYKEVIFCDNGGGIDMSIPTNGLGLQMCHEITAKYNAILELNNNSSGLCAHVIFQ
ncbi:MAG: ABC transporter substrate-binding protein [Sulfuricurvum sp.]|nr:ABC transporter substrate-binding protein [Sulfuricurvum sp.]